MILTKNIEIVVNNNRIKIYRNYFPNIEIKQGDKLLIPIKLLSHNSRLKLNVKCDICKKEKIVMYYNYMKSYNNCGIYCCSPKCAHFKNENTCIEKYGVKSTTMLDSVKDKIKITMIEKYGVENASQSEEIKKKKEETCMINYGVRYPLQSKELIEKSYNKKGFHIEDKTEYQKYRTNVYRITKKIKEKLMQDWDGFDYYDGEYIKENFNLKGTHKNYPTIDHMKSIFYCYGNNISAEECASLENLCITKRTINSSKNKKCE
jgi:hypothetical protein